MFRTGPCFFAREGLALSVLPLRANLGETVQQLVKRYGSPTAYAEATAQSPFGRVMYKAGAYELVLFIQNNVEVGARVSKLDKSALTSDEITNILSNDTNGSPWIPVPSDNPNNTQWARADKAAVIYDKANHLLIFTSGEMMKTITAPLPPAQSGQAAPRRLPYLPDSHRRRRHQPLRPRAAHLPRPGHDRPCGRGFHAPSPWSWRSQRKRGTKCRSELCWCGKAQYSPRAATKWKGGRTPPPMRRCSRFSPRKLTSNPGA